MATGTILDMFMPPTAETVGTVRTQRIADEPYTDQIRNAGMSVMDAMLSAARDKVVELASATEAGQNLIRTAAQQQTQQQIQKWGPFILIGLVVAAFLMGGFLFRGR